MTGTLTPEQIEVYAATLRARTAETARRRRRRHDQAWVVAQQAAHVLRSQFGVTGTLVAERIDGSLPSGPNWHQDLLRQMTAELPGIRAAVLSPDLFPTLDRYRGFRHVVRNVYAYVLDPRLGAVLIEDLPEADERVRAQLAAFADSLEAIAEAAGD